MMGEIGSDGEGDGYADDGAAGGKHETFGDELTNEASAGGTESGAHGEFLSARGHASEEQVGKIDADDEEDQADSAPKNEERAAKPAGDEILEVGEVSGICHEPIRIGMRGAKLRSEEIDFGLGLRQGNILFEAGDDGDGVAPIANLIEVSGDEEIDAKAGRKHGSKIEGLRKNADDGDGLIVKIDIFAEDIGIAGELLLPEGIGEDGDGRGAFFVFVWKKGAAENGSDAEGAKEIIGDHDGLNVLRITVAGHVEFGAAPETLVGGDFLEGLGVAGILFEGADVVGGAGESADAAIAGEPDELIGMRKWKRAKEEGVDDAEDDDVGADAESEDEDGDGGEGAIFAKSAEGVTQILEESFDQGETARVAMIFLGLLRAAELGEGEATGFGGRHAGFEIVFDGEVEVRGNFLSEIVVELIPVAESGEAMEEAKVHGLLAAQRGGWVNACGALRGDVSGGEGYGDEDGDDEGEGDGVVGFGVEEQGGDEAGDEYGACSAGGYAECG